MVERSAEDAAGNGKGYGCGGRTRSWRFALLALGALVLLGFVLRRPILVASAAVLDVGEAPVQADLIHLLGGAIDTRPLMAADLYHRGFAPKILLIRVRETEASRLGVMPNETDATRQILILSGVPDSAIIVVSSGDGVASTTDEARVLRRYLEMEDVERVLVVTSAYHTRRARWNLDRQLKGVPVEFRMISAAESEFDEKNWWRSESGLLTYAQEYLKFVHNLIYR